MCLLLQWERLTRMSKHDQFFFFDGSRKACASLNVDPIFYSQAGGKLLR